MTRPRLLDLFCGAGGAAVGYHRAGFDVVGVDIEPQPRFPFEFVQADATTFPLDGFDAVHASPPCQAHSALHGRHAARDCDTGWMLAGTLWRLRRHDRPWIVENVSGAGVGGSFVVVCGAALGLSVVTGSGGVRWLKRHRLFASNVGLLVPPCACSADRNVIGVYGHGSNPRTGPNRGWIGNAAECRQVMGIDWMRHREVVQAIPPAYTEMLGGQLLAAVVRL